MGLIIIVVVIGGAAAYIVPRLMGGDLGLSDGRTMGKVSDSTRISHIKQLQTAVEIYFVEYGDYPSTNNMWVDIMETTEPCVSLMRADLLQECFSDPGEEHQYRYRSSGTTYALQATLQESGAFCNLNAQGDCVRTVTESTGARVPEGLE